MHVRRSTQLSDWLHAYAYAYKVNGKRGTMQGPHLTQHHTEAITHMSLIILWLHYNDNTVYK